jgi:hypothetical protein
MADDRTDHFRQNFEWLHRMTLDFVDAIPDDRWDYTPDPPHAGGAGGRFGPFCKQLRHVIQARGVYTTAMITKSCDFSRSHEYYGGPLTREALRRALVESRAHFLDALEALDITIPIDFGGTPFHFDNFACEVIQHESIHHGQWSVYAALGGFATPRSWQTGWKL